MSTTEPFVSIVIPCRNEATCIEASLASILTQQTCCPFEVIVADGMSDDGTRQKLARLEEQIRSEDAKPGRNKLSLRVIDNPKMIVPSGLNAAIQSARGEIIIRLDAHSEYAPDYIAQCVEVLKKTGAENVGGPPHTRPITYMEKVIAAAYHSPFGVGGARFHDINFEGYVDTVMYGCWPKRTFEKFGYFDEELVRNQDDEHNLRITLGGGKIYQSRTIRHWYRPRSSLRMLFKQYTQYGYWKVRVIQKHRRPASWRHLVPGTFLLALLSLLVILTGSSLSAPFWPLAATLRLPTALLLLLVLGSYFGCLLIASALTAAKSELRLLPGLLLVFPAYHFGYGCGFLSGFWDFIVRKRTPRGSFTCLTR